MTPKQQRLIKDIAELFVKYDARDWSAVVQLLTLENSDYLADLRDIIGDLTTKTKTPRPATSGPKNGNSKSGSARVKPLTKRLQTLRSALSAKQAFSTQSELRQFALSLGIKEELTSQRPEAVEQIITYLSSKPDSRVREILKTAKPLGHGKTDFNNEFARWAAIILKANG
jgi:hypothetical protein